MGSSPTVGRAAVALAGFCLLALALLGRAGTAAADSCPNAAVRIQQGAQGLADCRAYEMVSPVEKGNDLLPNAPARGSIDGNGFEYEAFGAFSGAESANHANQYVGWRSPTGWTTEALNPYSAPDFLAAYYTNGDYYELTPDLTRGVLLASHDPNDRSGDFSEDQKRLYLRTKGVSSFTPLGPPALSPGFLTMGPHYAGSSTDMSRIFIESSEQLTAEAPPFTTETYEWHKGEFSLIGTLPNGEVAPGGALIGQGAEETADFRQAVSGDGSQVVLSMGSPPQLYLRENGEPKLISTSRKSGEVGTPAADGATFVGSSSVDGKQLSKIYFASPDALTEDAEAEPSVYEANELYAYDVESGELSFLSVRTNPAAEPSARVFTSWVAASGNGDYVYFVASGALTPGTVANGPKRLYLWHNGELKELGALNAAPNQNIYQVNWASLGADGKRLLLLAEEPLTADGPAGIAEAYLYDATSGDWTCVSCNPDGTTTKPAALRYQVLGYAGLAGQPYRAHSLSSDGSRVFFETAEPLTPRDGNGAADVYEWRDGKANLVSSGRGPSGANLLDTSRDGQDVFIATREQLVPQDKDGFFDVYDVREDGGFLHEAPPVPCSGDSCQGTPSSAREWSAPGSARLAAPGSANKQRHARCVKPRQAKKVKKAKKGAKAKAGKRARAARAKRRCAKPRQVKKKHRANAKHRARARGKGGNR